MNPKRIVKLSNIIGVVSIILLIYWIFVFSSIQIFGLKVFKQNLTETFYMSILGILALMFGALMINIMFNLTRIGDKQNADGSYKSKRAKNIVIAFVLSFPLIFGLLLAGDYYTGYVKEKSMIKAAATIVDNNTDVSNQIADYTFTQNWIKNTNKHLILFGKLDRYFPSAKVLVKDTLERYNVYLEFDKYTYFPNDTILPNKQNLLKSTTLEERDYLKKVFEQNLNEVRFSKHRGNYELFYPYTYNGKTVVFYFSDYQQYGKASYESLDTEVKEETVMMEPIEEIEVLEDTVVEE